MRMCACVFVYTYIYELYAFQSSHVCKSPVANVLLNIFSTDLTHRGRVHNIEIAIHCISMCFACLEAIKKFLPDLFVPGAGCTHSKMGGQGNRGLGWTDMCMYMCIYMCIYVRM